MKILKKLFRTILVYIAIYTIIIGILYFIMSSHELAFRNWFSITSILIIILGIIAGIIQLLLKIKKKVLKRILMGVVITISLLLSPVAFLASVIIFNPEHVVEKDGKKYVAYVYSFLSVYVDYYDYKNLFVVGKKIRFEEYWGKGGYDPFVNTDIGKVINTIYYDENGNTISTQKEDIQK